MIECVIFDIDGTILDTEKAVVKSLQRMAKEELGRDYEYEQLTFAMGIPGSVTLTRLEFTDIEATWKKWNEYMEQEPGGISIFDGIKEILTALQQRGIKTGVVTSRNRYEVDYSFVPFGLMEYMQHLVCADDVEQVKPHPEPILKYLEMSGINPANAVYIGDTIYNKQCAQDAGVKFALALWGARNPEDIGGDYLLETPLDILKLL